METIATEAQKQELFKRYRTGYHAISILSFFETLSFVVSILVTFGGAFLCSLIISTNKNFGLVAFGIALSVGFVLYLARVIAVGLLQIMRAVLDTAVFSCSALTHDMRMELLGILVSPESRNSPPA